jgi:phosphatidylinositol glycan class U
VWIYWGSGNANFFYAITLVYAGGAILLITDTGYAMLHHLFLKQHPEYKDTRIIHIQ